MSNIKGVVFDIGGVVVGSPIVGINKYEKSHGLPHHYLNHAITMRGQNSAFQRFERNELDLYTFYEQFGRELSDAPTLNEWYLQYCKNRGIDVPSLPDSIRVDGRELFGIMMQESLNPDRNVLTAVRRLKQSGKFRIAALTNNFSAPKTTDPRPQKGKERSLEEELAFIGMGEKGKDLKAEFDMYIESAIVGMRKPDPRFFKYALDQLQLKPEETVFLDDIGINLKAAASLGINTIRVEPLSSLPALRKLEAFTGMKLVDDEVAREEEERVRGLLRQKLKGTDDKARL
ncbi:epoxide hydrolase N-termina [Tilletiaria anomala UBC 951]|uniref:Epoxide hydrolase N-termina n=1 Tax=Tilletiaria anomala (strain ATCC 24038 / CBS 436.72 / UBC 951) TaxID=1037660 RepID=A0A066VFL4_TILAU|nr:epoxide hydrolase N-termina [Tilletiaria anomala UBC 951]KDN40261.1 epoxide hydrolase N-termina [Tilletiaria anomala UBC 951]